MGEVRQAKKAATRRALARATAALARDQGADAVSIAEITTMVGVSQRTFHNYFDSKEDAIMEFAVFCVDNLIDTMEMLPPGANTSVIAAVEQAVIMHLDVPDAELESFYSFRLLRQQFDTRSHEKYNELREDLKVRVLARVRALYPELSDWAVQVQLACAATAAKLALDRYYSYCHTAADDADGKSAGNGDAILLVHEAFAQLKR